MASGDPVKELCKELTCPICLEYFKEPVTTSCGHNFCQSCLDQWWEEKEASCPQCRKKVRKWDIGPNRQLATLVEIAMKLGSQKAEEKGRVCQRHQEPLKLFCKHHEVPICVVCDRSKEHENDKVIPLDEALKEYKGQILKLLETLQKEKKTILSYKVEAVRESQDLLVKTQRAKEKTVATFMHLHQFLEEQERNLLDQMEKVEKEISAKWEEHLARLSEELSSLSKLIQEIEEKNQQPASELLQDIKHFMQRCENKEKFEPPVVFPPALKWKIWDFCDINPFLKGVMKQFRAHVTLDPDTAHSRLILSEDHRCVRLEEEMQDLPDNPERFNYCPYVLGQEGFTGGRHFWEVLVENGEEWFVGVARKSVERKDFIPCGPEAGIWQMGKWKSGYMFSSNNHTFPYLTLSEEPKRVRVTLNYEGGQVAFYDADSAALIFKYPPASFSGETLLPLFHVEEKAQLELSP
nr:PREDICTED: E3 ubiquitin-protein ligase TRIM39 isoform X2 [Anolis carolinensis]|eukprot:XP_016847384.1 PREDICTED: E3 ubiquitin-protein ligase TRIM39 isoform X2 [Anolis carolinensis]